MSTEIWSLQKWQKEKTAYVAHRKLKLSLKIKRLIDFTAALLGCIVLSPVLLAIAIAVRLSSPGPILFRQQRPGKLGQPFTIYKFRTMTQNAEKQWPYKATFKDDPRITRVGKFLRDYHLDELPQLFNVLSGDMSLVGPRPRTLEAMPSFNDWEKQRFYMPPGITGWQQVNGGARLNADERIVLDVWYVNNWTVWLDIKILLRTVGVVLRKEGVYGADGWQRGR